MMLSFVDVVVGGFDEFGGWECYSAHLGPTNSQQPSYCVLAHGGATRCRCFVFGQAVMWPYNDV
jgi:hypothetical protein